MTDKIHVVIIDDHPLFRQGVVQTLSSAPDIEVIGEGGTAQDAVRLASEHVPDILLLDIDIPGGGLTAAQAVAARAPVTRIVMLTVSEEEEHLLTALRSGARAYVLKGVSGRDLIAIVRGVWAGEVYVTPALATSLLLEMTRPAAGGAASGVTGDRAFASPLEELTEREHEILELVAGGLSNKEIGQQLHLTEKTVKHHMTNILQKLQVRNRVEAALLAQRTAQRTPKTF
jgi:two-component system, NarL family, nitrate/nitrite response regulator NarL